ncbi:MAG TPA: MFS transporter [Baekduia sp.]|uniref:MFS transporter n=1 Tax=Baekduia sp. TaxID=2600305 RepID=UPI002D7761BA|nr:MFS transporter [Baekduia sp.]HET6505452.1 MFS transporter [Baekduia sp.]
MTHATEKSTTSIFHQPRSVYAVAFASVVAFMGIGLVDPILPSIAENLNASHSQVELLFTSYFAVMAVAMLVTGWVSSRIGAKRTLLGGLALVVVFASLAGTSDTVAQLVGFRGGWGLGNSLFTATALSAIVGAASGGVASAIILYEAALGLGLASGPLLGGELGAVSWRAPFFGTAALMAVGFIAIFVLLKDSPKPKRKTSLSEPFKALGHGGLRTIALTALFYNFGFFTLLAFAPFPLALGVHELGYVFFGWGAMLAVFSVVVAPRLRARTGTVPLLTGVLLTFAVLLAIMGVGVGSQGLLIAAVLVGGALIGLVNTVLTEALMRVAPDIDRPVASAAYSFVRFGGGAIAPWLAGKLSEHGNEALPFYVAAVVVAASVVPLLAGRSLVRHVDADEAAAAHAPAAAPAMERPVARRVDEPAPLLLAVDGSPAAERVTAEAARVALLRGRPVHVMHVLETDVVGDEAIARESDDTARATLTARLDQLHRAGVDADGEILSVAGRHADVASLIAHRAGDTGAGVIVVGRPAEPASLTDLVTREAPVNVLVVA